MCLYSHFEHDTASITHRLIVIWTCYLEIISLLLSLSVFDRLTSADMRPSCSHGEKKLLGETSYTVLGFVYTIPDSSYADTKTISDGASVHTAEEWWSRSGFYIKHYQAAPHRS